MSDRSHAVPTPEGEYFESSRFSGLSLLLGAGAILCFIACAIGAYFSPKQFSFSWLFAFAVYFTLCAGCLFWTIVHYATDAEWTVVVRRQLENIGMLFPVLLVFFLPILFFRHQLYEWMNIAPGSDHLLDAKRGYLNWNFFLVRAALFFLFFILSAYALRSLSVKQDKDGNPIFTVRLRKVAFASLPLFAFALTFAAFDWLMGLEFRWFSTMWGPYIFAGSTGGAMSLLVLVITALRKAGYLKEVVTLEHYHIMGKWMLAFCVFWAYIGFSQYMLYWYANIPEETHYFLRRNTESWWYLSTLLVFGRFFIAFGILLLRSIKKQPHRLCILAGWIVLMQILDIYIVVLPALHMNGVHVSILDLLCLVGMGCALTFVYLRIVGKSSLFPVRDPRLIESLRLSN